MSAASTMAASQQPTLCNERRNAVRDTVHEKTQCNNRVKEQFSMNLHRPAAIASLALVFCSFSGCEKKQTVPTPEEAAKAPLPPPPTNTKSLEAPPPPK